MMVEQMAVVEVVPVPLVVMVVMEVVLVKQHFLETLASHQTMAHLDHQQADGLLVAVLVILVVAVVMVAVVVAILQEQLTLVEAAVAAETQELVEQVAQAL
jgi:hypothetical protein|tara:strand:+ start:572 stop:874 length:303 start_codon:yes stop_codon:yes gene_type:complete